MLCEHIPRIFQAPDVKRFLTEFPCRLSGTQNMLMHSVSGLIVFAEVEQMRDGFGLGNMRESLRFLNDLRLINKEMRRMIYGRASLDREEVADLSKLAKNQRRMIEQNPSFYSARERFEIDKEKLTGMHLLQQAIKFLRNNDLKTGNLQPGDPVG